MQYLSRISGFCLLFALTQGAFADQLTVGDFSHGRLDGWSDKSFSGETRYRLQGQPGQQYLRADSAGTASAYYREIRVDLRKTPVLHWRWRKLKSPAVGNERSKGGDDFAARVYVVHSGGLFFWKTLAINYVWSRAQPPGSVWNNPFAGSNAKMVALRDDKDSDGWHEESRNVYEDFKKLQGKTFEHIDGVAIMTDSDNSHSSAAAEYGDIYFAAQ